MTFNVGDRVIHDFDGRGMAEVVGEEDGMYSIVYVYDRARSSQYVSEGECVGASAAELLSLVEAA